MCQGDRMLRHNALRNATNRFVKAAALRPVKEKAGLLPPRLDADAIREKTGSRGRRPADIWVPQWRESGPAALDFAVTSGLRADALHTTAVDARSCVTDYENVKRQYLQTEAQCASQGLQFVPMVIEAHGGSWGPVAKDAWKWIAKQYASTTGISDSLATSEIAQRISTALHRETARAILRRLAPLEEEKANCSSAAWLPDSMEW